MVSGDMYKDVPTFILSLKPYRDFTENPKSDIFHLFPIRNMLAGFRSLWMMP